MARQAAGEGRLERTGKPNAPARVVTASHPPEVMSGTSRPTNTRSCFLPRQESTTATRGGRVLLDVWRPPGVGDLVVSDVSDVLLGRVPVEPAHTRTDRPQPSPAQLGALPRLSDLVRLTHCTTPQLPLSSGAPAVPFRRRLWLAKSPRLPRTIQAVFMRSVCGRQPPRARCDLRSERADLLGSQELPRPLRHLKRMSEDERRPDGLVRNRYSAPYPGPLGQHPARFGRRPAPLGQHSTTLGRRSASLGQHSATFGRHPATLGRRSATLGRHSAPLG